MVRFRGLRAKPATVAQGRPSRVGTPAVPLAGSSSDAPVHAVLLFMTSSCAPCRHVWSALAEIDAHPEITVVTPSSTTESRRAVEQQLPPGVNLVMSSRAWFDYGAGAAPWMTVVRDGITVAEGPAPPSTSGLLAALEELRAPRHS